MKSTDKKTPQTQYGKGSRRSVFQLKVGATRFERATSASQTRRSSQAELRPDLFVSDTVVLVNMSSSNN